MTGKLKILAIDDDSLITELICGFLEKDYIVEAANNSEEGFAKFTKNNHDIVLIDLIMPGDDGFILVKKILATGIDTKIIIVSGADPATKKKIGGQNISGILGKPFTRKSLTKTIEKVLSEAKE